MVKAPKPQKAAWPNEVRPPTPVSTTSPIATSAPSPMLLSSVTQNTGTPGSSGKHRADGDEDEQGARGWTSPHSSSSVCVVVSERTRSTGMMIMKTMISLKLDAQNEAKASTMPTNTAAAAASG